MSPSSWRLLGIGLVIFGLLEYFGVLQVFSGDSTSSNICLGANLLGVCIGITDKHGATVVNGSNAELGGVSVAIGLAFYLTHRSGN